MKILSLGLDPLLIQKDSVPFNRQKKYFDQHTIDMVLLLSGSREVLTEGTMKIIRPGAGNKISLLIKTFLECWKLSSQEHYDMVLTQDVLATGIVGYVVSRFRGIPLVTQLHGNYLDNPLWTHEEFQNRILNSIGKWVLKRSAHVRCVSKRIQDEIVSRYRIPQNRTASIPIGTDLTIFTPAVGGEKKKTILFVGRLLPEKSPLLFLDVVIELMKKYPWLEAAVAGDGPCKGEMEELMRQKGLSERIHFLGSLDPAHLASWYRSSLCLVHTAAWEGWGMPMIEALACGCPVVTTDTGCAGEAVIDARNGYVVAIDDTKALIESTEKIITHESLQQHMSKHAVQDAHRWSFESLKKQLLSFYGQAIR